jgi:hypothetical protein
MSNPEDSPEDKIQGARRFYGVRDIDPNGYIDLTVWNPDDPEHAIEEDPFHGPSAVLGLLAIPPMKREDGTYYVFGASYICSTNTFDGDGNPFHEIGGGMGMNVFREIEVHKKWLDAYHANELPPR